MKYENKIKQLDKKILKAEILIAKLIAEKQVYQDRLDSLPDMSDDFINDDMLDTVYAVK